MRSSRSTFVASTFLALALLGAACGDDTGGAEGIEASCERAADFSVTTATELGCNPVDRDEFVAECEAEYSSAPECAGDLDIFVSCLTALPAGSWSCDATDDELTPPATACPDEAQALVACLQG